MLPQGFLQSGIGNVKALLKAANVLLLHCLVHHVLKESRRIFGLQRPEGTNVLFLLVLEVQHLLGRIGLVALEVPDDEPEGAADALPEVQLWRRIDVVESVVESTSGFLERYFRSPPHVLLVLKATERRYDSAALDHLAYCKVAMRSAP